MASNLSHVHSDENISGENARYKPTLSIVNCVDLLSIYADICKVFWTYSKNEWNRERRNRKSCESFQIHAVSEMILLALYPKSHKGSSKNSKNVIGMKHG